jgi:hypothetical protein
MRSGAQGLGYSGGLAVAFAAMGNSVSEIDLKMHHNLCTGKTILVGWDGEQTLSSL